MKSLEMWFRESDWFPMPNLQPYINLMALALADRAEAKVKLKQIAKDYAGTDAGRRAALAAASR